MAGHSGNTNKTIRGLQVIKIDQDASTLTISGTIPGHRNTFVTVTKIGKSKNPITLKSNKPEADQPVVEKNKL